MTKKELREKREVRNITIVKTEWGTFFNIRQRPS